MSKHDPLVTLLQIEEFAQQAARLGREGSRTQLDSGWKYRFAAVTASMKTRLSLSRILLLALFISSSLLERACADSYPLTLSQTGSGTVTATDTLTGLVQGVGSQSYLANSEVAIDIVPNPGWYIKAIDCSPETSQQVPPGQVVPLTFVQELSLYTVNMGHGHVGWRGFPKTLSIYEANTIAVTFAPWIEVHKSGSGTVTSSPAYILTRPGNFSDGIFDNGEIVTLTATPANGATFIGWGGDATGTAPLVLDSTQPHYITATFTNGNYNLNISQVGKGSITTKTASIGAGYYPDGTDVEVNIEAAPGWTIYTVGEGPQQGLWDSAVIPDDLIQQLLDGSGGPPTNASGLISMNQDKALQVTFVQTPLLRVFPDGTTQFKPIKTGDFDQRTFVVTNASSVTLTGTATTTPPFSVSGGGSYTLAPGASQTVTVNYSPASAGNNTATLTFTGGTGQTRQLTGTAFDDPTATTGSIAGRVTDSQTLQPINGVGITVVAPGTSLFNEGAAAVGQTQGSGAQAGSYTISGLRPGAPYHLFVTSGTNYYVGEADATVIAGQATKLDIQLDPVLPANQPPVLTPQDTPVVLVRGFGQDMDWSAGESGYWGDPAVPFDSSKPKMRAYLIAQHFSHICDCNEKDNDPTYPVFNGNGHVINGEDGIQQNAEWLEYYVQQKCLQFKRDKGSYPSSINIIAHSMGGLITRQAMIAAGFFGFFEPVTGTFVRIKVGKVVMLATPNAGTLIADLIGNGPSAFEYMQPLLFSPSWTSTKDLKTANIETIFNPNHPWPSGVSLYLYAGTGGYLADTSTLLGKGLYLGSHIIADYYSFVSPQQVNDGAVPRPSVSGSSYEWEGFTLAKKQTFAASPAETQKDTDISGGSPQDHLSLLGDFATIQWAVSKLTGTNSAAPLQNSVSTPRRLAAASKRPAAAPVTQAPMELFAQNNSVLVSGTSATVPVIADAATTLQFQLFVSGTDAVFRLKDPSGNAIDSSTPQSNSNIHYSATVVGSNSSLSYQISNPSAGTWTVILDGSGMSEPQANCSLLVFGDSNVALLSQTGALFNQGQDVVVACALADLGSNPPTAIQNASITATVQLPDSSTTVLNLFDDGLHNDGLPNDGIYATVLPAVSQTGQYSISYGATAQNTLDQPLQRVASGTFSVSSEDGSILGDPVFAAVDTDGDGIADSMQAKCWVNPKVAGSYILSGQLVDAGGTLQIPASAPFYADGSGPMTVSLFFDLTSVKAAGGNGDFHIENLQLFEVTTSGTAWLDTYQGVSALRIGPKITVQPQGQVVPKGGKAVFSVTAQSTTTLHYQWKRNGQVITGAVNAMLTIAQAAVGDAGKYTVVVSDDTGSVTSMAAALVVGVPPFVSFKGTYQGLIQPDSFSNALSGRITVSFAGAGTFTGTVVLGGKSYSVRGTFDQFGVASVAIGNTGLRIELQLDVTNHSDQLTGKITDNGNVVANVQADRPPAGFTAKKPSPQAGRYTLLLPPDAAHPEATYPQGNGYATLTVSYTGLARIAGLLGDTTPFSLGGTATKNGQVPVYLALYVAKGSVSGWLNLHDSSSANQVEGTLNWFKPATLTPAWYPAEFSGETAVEGSGYISPPKQPQILPTGPAKFTISGGNVTVNPAAKDLTIDAQNKIKIVGTEKFTMTLAPATGLFTGTFPDAGKKSRTFKGAVLQKQNRGAGLFKGEKQTGSVELQPAP